MEYIVLYEYLSPGTRCWVKDSKNIHAENDADAMRKAIEEMDNIRNRGLLNEVQMILLAKVVKRFPSM